ncbi:hypothetical protein D918_06465 [Trichuris suis]|nr:hypothetical protein D918_06465 [Trichuris suis]
MARAAGTALQLRLRLTRRVLSNGPPRGVRSQTAPKERERERTDGVVRMAGLQQSLSKSSSEVSQPEATEPCKPNVNCDFNAWQQVLSGGRLTPTRVPYGQFNDDNDNDDQVAAATRNINWFIVTCHNRLRQLVSRRACTAGNDSVDAACFKVIHCPFEEDTTTAVSCSFTKSADCSVSVTSFPLTDSAANRTVLCRTNDKQGETATVVNDRKAALCTSFKVDQPVPAIDMDIDLDGAIQRFEHYCSIYSDSPLSNYTSKQRLKRKPKQNDESIEDKEELANNTSARKQDSNFFQATRREHTGNRAGVINCLLSADYLSYVTLREEKET